MHIFHHVLSSAQMSCKSHVTITQIPQQKCVLLSHRAFILQQDIALCHSHHFHSRLLLSLLGPMPWKGTTRSYLSFYANQCQAHAPHRLSAQELFCVNKGRKHNNCSKYSVFTTGLFKFENATNSPVILVQIFWLKRSGLKPKNMYFKCCSN